VYEFMMTDKQTNKWTS